MSKRNFLRLDFAKGLNTFLPEAAIDNGTASELENFVPDGGVLRPRDRWNRDPVTGASIPTGATGMHYNPNDNYLYVASGTYNSTSLPIRKGYAGPWAAVETVTLSSTAWAPVRTVFANSDSVTLYGQQGFPSSRLHYYNGATTGEAGTTAVAGTALTFYLERFWSGGAGALNVQRLYYTGIGAYNDWSSSNHIPIAPWDGGGITCVQPALGGLLIGKTQGLFFLSGSSFADFAVNDLGGGDAAYGQSICPTPWGTVVVGSTEIWLWGGGTVERISDGLLPRQYGNAANPGVSTALVGDQVYICAPAQGVTLVRDMRRGTWRTISQETSQQHADTDAINAIGILTQGDNRIHGMPLSYQTSLAPTLTGASYLGPIYNHRTLDQGVQAARYSATTGVIALGDGVAPVTIRHLHLLVKQSGYSAGETGLCVTLTTEAGTQTKYVPTTTNWYNARRVRLDYANVTAFTAKVALTVDPLEGETTLFDIDSAILEYEVGEPR